MLPLALLIALLVVLPPAALLIRVLIPKPAAPGIVRHQSTTRPPHVEHDRPAHRPWHHNGHQPTTRAVRHRSAVLSAKQLATQAHQCAGNANTLLQRAWLGRRRVAL